MNLHAARHIAADVFERALRPGDNAVDATMGRGRDTLRLCQLVGETGHVHAFDVQEDALTQTRDLLLREGMLQRASLYLMGHEKMAQVVPPGIRLVAFNLGWLPGGDKRITTRVDTSLAAIEAALQLLSPQGLAVICLYPGHPEGERELAAVTAFAQALPPQRFTALRHDFINASPGAPVALIIQKQ